MLNKRCEQRKIKQDQRNCERKKSSVINVQERKKYPRERSKFYILKEEKRMNKKILMRKLNIITWFIDRNCWGKIFNACKREKIMNKISLYKHPQIDFSIKVSAIT